MWMSGMSFPSFFSSSKFKATQQMVVVESIQQKSDRLSVLFKKRESFELKKTSDHLAVLEEALVIKREMRREGLRSEDTREVSDSAVLVSLYTDLLAAQMSEALVYLEALAYEPREYTEDSQVSLLIEIAEVHASNVAEIIFASEKYADSEDENEAGLKAAVDGKYNAMHDQLLIQALIDEMGEDEWRRLSEQERRRKLLELKLKERQLLKEGRYDEANALLGGLLNDEERLKQILGDNKEETERKLLERMERRKQRLSQGMTEEECDELEAVETAQEEEEERQRRKNVLLYLEDCSLKEKDELLRRLRAMEDEQERQKQKRVEMLRLHREERRLRQETKFDTAAMLLNLCQDTEDRFRLSHEEQRNRQRHLAKQRLEEARERRRLGENLVRGETITYDGWDEAKIEESVMKVMDVRHKAERDLLCKLIDESCEGEERDEARVMTDEELKQQTQEVEELFNAWRESDNVESDEGAKILTDSAAVSVEVKKRDMQADGDLASDEDVKVALMADLQMKQDSEASHLMQELGDIDVERKRAHLQKQQKMLNKGIYANVAEVLFESSGQKGIPTDNDEGNVADGELEVVKALEKKYDVMKDKLIMEALMKQMGEDDWARLSELEKQRKILDVKREERRLRRDGKIDQAAALLGQYMDQTGEISRLLGESEAESKRRLQEKLELKRKLKEQREAEGLDAGEETLDSLADEEIGKRKRNVLENLDLKLEEEKAALLASLHNHTDQLMREKQRQMSLAKLKREQKRLKQEEKFDSAAMIFALHQETSEKLEQHILNERERNRQLARERLEARKRLKADKESLLSAQTEADDLDPDIKDVGVYLQDGVIQRVEKHHGAERDVLVCMLESFRRGGAAQQASKTSDQNLQSQLSKVQKEYEAWEKNAAKMVSKEKKGKMSQKNKDKMLEQQKKKEKQLQSILEKALAIKYEQEGRRLKLTGKLVKDEDVLHGFCVGLLANLQEKQNNYLETMMDSLEGKSESELRDLMSVQDRISNESWYKTLSVSLFTTDAFDLVDEMEVKEQSSQVALQEEFEREKQELLEKGKRENINIDELLSDLEAKYSQRQKVSEAEMREQREKLAQRLAQRKNDKDDENWMMAQMTNKIFDKMETNKNTLKLTVDREKNQQNDLLQQRLQARREARKRAEGAVDSMASREATSVTAGDVSRGSSFSNSPSRKTSREMSFVSEDQKQAIYDQLVMQEQQRQIQIAREQSKQQEALKRRLENRVNKRETEAAALFSLGERQKTILEKSQKDERERQIAQMQERVTRIRESRSKSPKAKAIQEEDEEE